MTTKMTDENLRDALVKEVKKIMPCTCLDAYKIRKMADPECSWCGYGEDIVELILDRDRKISEVKNVKSQ